MTPTEARERDARHLLDLADRHEAQRAKVGQLAAMGNLTGRDLDVLRDAESALMDAESDYAWDWAGGIPARRVYASAGTVVTCARDGDCEVVYDQTRQDVTT